ncbi:hypothetical protein C8A03DRAFT_38049, partial [Achaetomium macrosporum]
MEKYIYKRWFRPYRTEISVGQFLVKFIRPKGVSSHSAPPSRPVIDHILALNKAICAKADIRTQEDLGSRSGSSEQISDQAPTCNTRVLHPLFGALLIIVCIDEYNDEDSTTIGRFPVYLVPTGAEDGLSAPISFDSISDKVEPHFEGAVKTTLETAFDFVMALEAREAAAYGPLVDPLTVAVLDYTDEGVEDLTTLPSSQWVSDEKAEEWG